MEENQTPDGREQTSDQGTENGLARQKGHDAPRSLGAGAFPIKVLFAVLSIWAILIAVGTLWRPSGATDGNAFDVRRSLFVLGTMSAFLGTWAVALWSRERKNW